MHRVASKSAHSSSVPLNAEYALLVTRSFLEKKEKREKLASSLSAQTSYSYIFIIKKVRHTKRANWEIVRKERAYILASFSWILVIDKLRYNLFFFFSFL